MNTIPIRGILAVTAGGLGVCAFFGNDATDRAPRESTGLVVAAAREPDFRADVIRTLGELDEGGADGDATVEDAAGLLKQVAESMARWAERDLDGARRFLEDQPIHATRVAVALGDSFMRIFARERPAEAERWVRFGFADDSGELRPVVARVLALELRAAGRPAQAEAWLADPAVAATAYVREATREYARTLAAEDHAEGLRFSASLPRGSHGRLVALRETVQAWTARDREQAKEWILSISRAGEGRPELGATLDGRESVPDGVYLSEELDHAVAGHVLALAEAGHDPVQVRAAMEAILEPSTRRAVGRSLTAEASVVSGR